MAKRKNNPRAHDGLRRQARRAMLDLERTRVRNRTAALLRIRAAFRRRGWDVEDILWEVEQALIVCRDTTANCSRRIGDLRRLVAEIDAERRGVRPLNYKAFLRGNL